MAAAKKGTQMAPTEQPKALALATDDNKALLALGIEADAGAGMENADKDSYAIPFLGILQKLSPQLDRQKPEFIKDARDGDLILTSSGEIFKEEVGVHVIFCHFDRRFLRWRPKNEGGGFRGSYSPVEFAALQQKGEIVEEDGKLFNSEGELCKDTRVLYVLVVRDDGSATQAVCSFASTQIKKSKLLMTQINNMTAQGANGKFTPPMFAHIFHVTSVPESNDQGNWSGWKITRAGYVQDPKLYEAAKALHEAVKTSAVQMATPPIDAEPAGGNF